MFLTIQERRRPRGFLGIIIGIIIVVAIILIILALLRDKNKSSAEKASEYLALSKSEKQQVRSKLSADELAALDKAVSDYTNPAPAPTTAPDAAPAPAPPPPPESAPAPIPTGAPVAAPPPESAPAPIPTGAPVAGPAPAPTGAPGGGSVAPPVPAPAPTEAPAPTPPRTGLPGTEGPVAFTPELRPGDYLDRLFKGELDTHSQLYIPGYTYFQGVVGSGGPVTVAGQVRVIGGASGASGKLQNGAMVTTAPDYLDGKVAPSRNRFRVTEWKEVP